MEDITFHIFKINRLYLPVLRQIHLNGFTNNYGLVNRSWGVDLYHYYEHNDCDIKGVLSRCGCYTYWGAKSVINKYRREHKGIEMKEVYNSKYHL